MLVRSLGLILLWFALLAGAALLLATHLPVAFLAFVVVVAGVAAILRSVRRRT